MDPIGLAMENFDGAGQTRLTENGEPIDTSGDLNGIKYNDAKGLGQALRADPAATSCVVNRAYAYAVGRSIERTERETITHFEKQFAESGYRFGDLLRDIALSKAFYSVTTTPARSTANASEESKL